MPCFHPLDAWQCLNGDVVFTDNLARNDVIRRLSLPCGRCVGCRLERSRQWAVRCMHEASMHMFNSFVTLTYDDDHLPEYNSLNYKHFQDFMKRLRKSHNGVRFYMCGEYGEDFRVLIIMLFCLIVFLTEKSIPLEIRDQLFILLKLLLSSGLLVSLV